MATVSEKISDTCAVMAAQRFGGTDLTFPLAKPIDNWTLATIPGIKVTNGKCSVVISSDGRANNWIEVDDVALVRSGPAAN